MIAFFRGQRPYTDVTERILKRPCTPIGPDFWAYIFRFIRELQPAFSFMVLTVIATATISVFLNYPIKMATNALIAQDTGALAAACIVFSCLVVGRVLMEQLSSVYSYKGKFIHNGYLNSMLVQSVLRNPIRFFENNTQGKITSSILELENHTRLLYSFYTWHFAPNVIFVIVSACLIAASNPPLAAGFCIWTVAYLWMHKKQSKYLYDTALASGRQSALRDGLVGDIIANFRNILIFGRRDFEQYNLAAENSQLLHKQMRFRDAIAGGDLIDQLMVIAAYLTTFISCAWLTYNGRMTIGDFSMIVALVIGMTTRLRSATERLRYSIESYGKVKHALRFLFGEQSQVATRPPRTNVMNDAQTGTPAMIEFYDVSFTYPGNEKPVLQNINLTIRQGEKIGLVGASGAGKSTLVNMILRLYDADGGALIVDGEDVQTQTPETLSTKIAFIPQDTVLFHRTIRANIAYGRPNATEEDIVAAAKSAQAHNFIMAMPQGYDTMVGERGVKLSGGQRQRIAIARALLKDAPILILDEATSALDSEAEAQIQQAIEQAMQGKTVVAIAHRLSTIATMDRLIVMENGYIAEIGSHSELIAQNGIYTRLWQRQSGGFIGEAG